MTEDEIVEVYKMGLKSIEEIYKFIAKFGNYCHFNLRPFVVILVGRTIIWV